ncbi:immune-associated nucleotide-binding protein 9-like isoform X3 [Asparagus officinalis]|uniref:immune-associated nucleotide-binding protein 9-like isoform X3 n=1 Tax=Asparagus officinalis TaxID=4686 RepID=UPI00098E0EC2|nr:immune-associated nucleotide-binding protein 9-like isoform X3 [Asparagus officinalis]
MTNLFNYVASLYPYCMFYYVMLIDKDVMLLHIPFHGWMLNLFSYVESLWPYCIKNVKTSFYRFLMFIFYLFEFLFELISVDEGCEIVVLMGSLKSKSKDNILQLCKNRVMLFNNSTQDVDRRAIQLKQLLSLVDLIAADNGGKPFSDDIFEQLKSLENKEKEIDAMKGIQGYSEQDIAELKEQLHKSHEDQLRQVVETIERKLDEAINKLEKQLAEEQAARLEAEKVAREARQRSEQEITNLRERSEEKINILRKSSEQEINNPREQLRRAQEESQEFRKKAEGAKCNIL